MRYFPSAVCTSFWFAWSPLTLIFPSGPRMIWIFCGVSFVATCCVVVSFIILVVPSGFRTITLRMIVLNCGWPRKCKFLKSQNHSYVTCVSFSPCLLSSILFLLLASRCSLSCCSIFSLISVAEIFCTECTRLVLWSGTSNCLGRGNFPVVVRVVGIMLTRSCLRRRRKKIRNQQENFLPQETLTFQRTAWSPTVPVCLHQSTLR